MKTKFRILFLGLVLIHFVKAQNIKSLAWLNNDSIHCSFGYINSDDLAPKQPPAEYVVHVKLTKIQAMEANSLTYENWISLLEDEKTDFATNWLLYDIYNMDVTLLMNYRNKRDDWALRVRERDIKMWKKILKKKIQKLDVNEYN